jgi:hypothetical protein
MRFNRNHNRNRLRCAQRCRMIPLSDITNAIT